MTSAKPSRRWYQFSVKALMLLVVAAALPCGWIKWRMVCKERERAAVAEISEKSWVWYDWERPRKANPPGPALLRKLLGDDFFSSVEGVQMHLNVTDEWLSRLGPFTDLKLLFLESCTDVTDKGLLCLTKLKRLNELTLNRTAVTDAGLEHIRGLSELRRLVLTNTIVTDAGLANVKELKKLEELSLWGTLVTDAGLVHLIGLSELRSLNLACQTGVTDASLVHLKALSKLTYFNAIDTGMTESGIADLQNALPKCQIFWQHTGKEAMDYEGRPLLRASQKALPVHNKAIALDPTNPVLFINRGLAWYEMGRYGNALADFDEGIRLDPTNASYYVNRAKVWYFIGQYDKALDDFEESVKLDPENAKANVEAIHPSLPYFYIYRAAACEAKGEFDKALDEYSKMIAHDSKYVEAFLGRAGVWKAKSDFDKAFGDYDKVIELDPDSPRGYKGRAWLHATCPDEKYRDGAKAIDDATKAYELYELGEWEDETILDTLAAAYAEAGHFDKAVEWQKKAIDILATPYAEAEVEDEADQIDKAVELQRKKEFQTRLKLYQEGKPYREEPK